MILKNYIWSTIYHITSDHYVSNTSDKIILQNKFKIFIYSSYKTIYTPFQ